MLIYAGIDEAGYGPMLGPLCVASSVFVLPDDDPHAGAPDLWQRLDGIVCRSRRDDRRRIAVDDSKKLKTASTGKAHPLKHLERGVLAFASRDDTTPANDSALFDQLGAIVDPLDWYDTVTPLPVGQSSDEILIDASRVSRVLSGEHLAGPVLRCEMIDAHELNRQVALMGTKAAVNLGAVFRLVEAIRLRWGADHPRIIIDRQGGRTHYLRDLQLAYPDASVQILAESPDLCRYRLHESTWTLTLSFVRNAEAGHLPVALASMVAKYVRELMMIRLNRYFLRHLPELKPTAGYVQDARRYLREVETVIRDKRLVRDRLIRSV